MSVISLLASVGMAVGPPCVYLDQYFSIIKRKDSTGFSIDVCGVLICANIIRVFFWFGQRFEIALLVQSVLMIAFQLALLYVCIKYRQTLLPTHERNKSLDIVGSENSWSRPYNFWQWESYGTYIEFIGALIFVNTILYIGLAWTGFYVDLIGIVALGLESTLPIPQLLSNYRRKSLSGFRMTVLAGWVLGDAFKTLYFFFQEGNSWQFKATACFQLSIDLLICGQAWIYRHNTASGDYQQPMLAEESENPSRQHTETRNSIEVELR
ncbi:hypothetical protein P389DRAFT_147427 [Cystobasidium minutum MCA 4210]|uniref:uncharacterized protein n=1 Tax=Cystobasidium minutum MCA 4210 TaxID=1397322 RepID=UPI0034CDC58C|eukprot:jgi/Rhomi1/147427/e_gw1.8.281.1